MNGGTSPMNPYALERSHGPMAGNTPSSSGASMSSEAQLGDESSYVTSSVMTAGLQYYQDATRTVHEMHLALLYLLSNPEEFQRALQATPPRGSTTLQEWNAEYDESTVNTTGEVTVAPETTPLPFVVFADDAEVVLPQAHTASQLFGIERMDGIELEAAAGVPALSQLFLRWLALMPGGDHINIIDPPGLTVMRIAGGRYRVTAAHRVIWTWMNEFAPLSPEENQENALQVGDLVTMTIVDVFETDNNGKLLSYCPTFDNRNVQKTNQASETLKKSSMKIRTQLSIISHSQAAHRVNQGVAHVTKMGVNAARSVASSVKHRVDESMKGISSPGKHKTPQNVGVDAKDFEHALNAAEANLEQPTLSGEEADAGEVKPEKSELYIASDVQRV